MQCKLFQMVQYLIGKSAYIEFLGDQIRITSKGIKGWASRRVSPAFCRGIQEWPAMGCAKAGRREGHSDRAGEQKILPLESASKFNLYRREDIPVAVGYELRVTKNFKSLTGVKLQRPPARCAWAARPHRGERWTGWEAVRGIMSTSSQRCSAPPRRLRSRRLPWS
jgi:hypothetical protein